MLISETGKLDFESQPSGALFSPDRVWRYALWRDTGCGKGSMVVVGLNPSTADESANDPTIRRCIGFASSWGFRTLVVANLFAFRATKPPDMRRAVDPVGPENDRWLAHVSQQADLTLAAWGNNGLWNARAASVMSMLRDPKCLGVTKKGAPVHPLYIRGDTMPVPFL